MSAVIETRSGPSTAAIVPSRPLASGDGARAIAFDAGGELSLDTFFSPVRGLAQLLPDASHAINLCADRYRFLVAFCPVALRGQTTLLSSEERRVGEGGGGPVKSRGAPYN